MTGLLVSSGAFADSPLGLIDVGASGGIAAYWRQYQPCLTAFGFDVLSKECERLNAAEKNPSVSYHDLFVGWEHYKTVFPDERMSGSDRWNNYPYDRTSAHRAWQSKRTSYAQWFNNDDPDVVVSDRRTSLDAFFQDRNVPVDFIKIDTDGQDYEVLCGAARVFAERQVLGVAVEVQFHGISHLHSNLFANIDRLLRERGFSLFDLQTYRYTRAVLPGHFVYGFAAQTKEGQVLAGDALYLRDLAAPGYEQRWGVELPVAKVLKLASLFEVFGLPDCAAELLQAKKGIIEGAHGIKVGRLLDLLAKQIQPTLGSFDEVNRQFDSSPAAFYPFATRWPIVERIPAPIRKVLSRIKRSLVG